MPNLSAIWQKVKYLSEPKCLSFVSIENCYFIHTKFYVTFSKKLHHGTINSPFHRIYDFTTNFSYLNSCRLDKSGSHSYYANQLRKWNSDSLQLKHLRQALFVLKRSQEVRLFCTGEWYWPRWESNQKRWSQWPSRKPLCRLAVC